MREGGIEGTAEDVEGEETLFGLEKVELDLVARGRDGFVRANSLLKKLDRACESVPVKIQMAEFPEDLGHVRIATLGRGFGDKLVNILITKTNV